MNQLLKTTLYKLILCNELKEEKKYELKKIIMYFSNVDLIEISDINWKSFQYHRNNATYRLLINICYLVLKGMILTTEKGKKKLASYLDDQNMHSLYEKFILEFYRKHFPEVRPNSKRIFWDTEDAIDFLPNMQSDAMLLFGDKKLIIDAKYYKKTMQSHYDSNKLISNHLYQIFAYVKNEDKYNTGLVSGMLLYAKTEEETLPNYEYNIGGNVISAKTLDLNKPFEMIKRQLESIIFNWLGEDFSREIN
jgi:5-methylcytosine-specific restriction enzyme subunit McrC